MHTYIYIYIHIYIYVFKSCLIKTSIHYPIKKVVFNSCKVRFKVVFNSCKDRFKVVFTFPIKTCNENPFLRATPNSLIYSLGLQMVLGSVVVLPNDINEDR